MATRRILVLLVSLRRGILVLLLLAAAVPGWAQCLISNYINQLVPSAVPMGGADFTLTVNGCGFLPGSVVNWNGNALVSTFVNNDQLTAVVPSADIALAGTASITVSFGGTVSNVAYFRIAGSFIDHLLPSAVPPGGADFTLTVNGTGFVSGSVVNWNGSALATTFVNNEQLTAAVPSANIASPGTASITVSSIGFVSNVAYLEIANPVPFINQPLVPSAVAPGGAGFTLTVNGTGFVPGSVINWNGSALVTTFVNSEQLTAEVASGDIASLGTASITVSTTGVISNVAYLEIANAKTSVSLSKTDYPVGIAPNSIASGDFNGDGELDLAVTNFADNTVSVLLGNGDGTFKPAVNYALYANGTGPLSVAVGDFNGDGKLDLAVVSAIAIPYGAEAITGGVSVLLGNGDGTFTLAHGYPATAPLSVAVGDFNGDGKLDLVVASCAIDSVLRVPDCSKGSVGVMLGSGDGTFQCGYPPYGSSCPLVNYAVGSFAAPNNQAQLVAVGDFNGDGNLDLAVANYGDGSVGVLLGYGDGTFHPMTSYAAGIGPSSVVIGDFNGDGKLDLAVSDGGWNTVSVLLGNGDGTFQSAVSYMAGPNPFSVSVGDFNGDGKLDLAVANANCLQTSVGACTSDGTVSVLLGNGDGTFSASTNFTVGIDPLAAAAGDFNGDGQLDLAVPNGYSSSVSILTQPTRTNQTITFPAPPSPAAYNTTFTVSPTANSGLPVTVTASGVCTISGFTVTMTSGTGTCSLTASQAGNATYNAAASVTQVVVAMKANASVSLANLNQTYTGGPLMPTAVTTPAGLAIVWSGAPDIVVGSYGVVATISDSNYEGSASGTFAIGPALAAATVTVTPLYYKAGTTSASNPPPADCASSTNACQQYSDYVNFTVAVSPGNLGGINALNNYVTGCGAAGTVPCVNVTVASASLGSHTYGPIALSPDSTGVNLVGALNNVAILQPPGTYTVTVSPLSAVNTNFTLLTPVANFTVAQEDAQITYTGLQYFLTSATATKVNVTVSFSLLDATATGVGNPIYDPYAGDITKATVAVSLTGVGVSFNGSCGPLTVSGIGGQVDPTTGLPSAGTVSCTISNVPVNGSYSVTAAPATGSYYIFWGDSQEAIITANGGTGFITGGGYQTGTYLATPNTSIGKYTASGRLVPALGTKMNFGFEAKNNKNNSNYQGGVNIVIRSACLPPGFDASNYIPQPGDDGLCVYQLKALVITGISETLSPSPATALVTAKGNFQDVTWPAAQSIGSLQLQLVMYDVADPGANKDTLGIQATDNAGDLLISNNWTGGKTVTSSTAPVIQGGNLQVH